MKEKKVDVLVIGDNNLDITTKVEEEIILGNIIFGEAPEVLPGGTGLNVAIAIKKLGLNVGFITSLSSSIIGQSIKNYLEEKDIDIKCSQLTSKKAGVVLEAISTTNKPTFIALIGGCSNTQISKKYIDENYISQAKNIFITGAIIFEEETFKALQAAIDIAKRNKIKIFFDPNIRILDPVIWNEKKKYFLEIIKQCDVAMPNELEIQMLFGNVNETDIKKYCDKENIELWITRGEKGSSYYNKGKKIDFPIYDVEVLDGHGAGDCYDGALIYGYQKIGAINDIGRIASIASGISVSRIGTAGSCPSRKEVEKILNS